MVVERHSLMTSRGHVKSHEMQPESSSSRRKQLDGRTGETVRLTGALQQVLPTLDANSSEARPTIGRKCTCLTDQPPTGFPSPTSPDSFPSFDVTSTFATSLSAPTSRGKIHSIRLKCRIYIGVEPAGAGGEEGGKQPRLVGASIMIPVHSCRVSV